MVPMSVVFLSIMIDSVVVDLRDSVRCFVALSTIFLMMNRVRIETASLLSSYRTQQVLTYLYDLPLSTSI